MIFLFNTILSAQMNHKMTNLKYTAIWAIKPVPQKSLNSSEPIGAILIAAYTSPKSTNKAMIELKIKAS